MPTQYYSVYRRCKKHMDYFGRKPTKSKCLACNELYLEVNGQGTLFGVGIQPTRTFSDGSTLEVFIYDHECDYAAGMTSDWEL